MNPRSRRSPEPSRRGPGRPPENGGGHSDLRERLIDAALARFVAEGIAASTIRGIATEAGVTPALLHYYFGDKPQLLDAVVETRLMPVLARLGAGLADADDDPRALVRGFVSGVFDAAEANPWLPTLWVREVLSEGGALRALLVERIAPQLPQALAKRFADAQEQGRINRALDPRLLVVSLIGLTMFPLAAAPVWRQVFEADDIDRERLLAHTLALIEPALEPDHAI